ncbi:hypothetical protein [Luteolibacter sp. LG18]|uniref:GumC family protein n=1 Tax=Luteolibacter sp. LG18 TaxID=2819286 RepID=UPI002B30826E|nr:hypothetical protein llg_42760 [Luteolibacter sp. LG18]
MNPTAHNASRNSSREDRAGRGGGFKFPLPFDPVRLLAGALAGWPWMAGCGLAGLIAGATAGMALNKPSFTTSASLLKRKVPQTVQASETGQSYRPADLNDATLLATLLAADPLEKAVARTGNGLDAKAVRKMVEASQQKGTDIYYVTYHSPLSAADAEKFTRIWSEEIEEYTKRLQQSDARAVRSILQNQVADMEKGLTGINRQIMDFAREKQYFGTDTQLTATLNRVGQTTLELENAKASLSAKDDQITALTAELRRQSPIEFQLKDAREELAKLRATYTDENPLVKAKLQGIAYLESKLKEFEEQGPASLESYTGTPLGNQLFLDILSLQNQRTEFLGKIKSYTELLRTEEERLKEFPAIVSGYRELDKSRESMMASLTLLSNRLKETEIFASSAPGYWVLFEGPENHPAAPASKLKGPALLGIAGLAVGTGGAFALLLLWSLRDCRRSVLECCSATNAPLLLEFHPDTPSEAVFDLLWLGSLSAKITEQTPILCWTALVSPEDERTFWKHLAMAAKRDGSTLPEVVDLSPDGLWETTPPDGLRWTRTPSTGALLHRASSLPPVPERPVLAGIQFTFALASGESPILGRAQTLHELTAAYLPPIDGTIASVRSPDGWTRRAGDQVSRFLARHFSRPSTPPPQPTTP